MNIGFLLGAYRQVVVGFVAACLLSTFAAAHPGSGIAVDRTGQIFFLDTGSGLWRIDTKGGLTHLSQLRNHWLAIDPNNAFTQARLPSDPEGDWVITSVGSNPTALISTDFPIAIGQDGDLYYQTGRQGRTQIVRTSSRGASSVVATTSVPWLNGITAGADGSIYYTENSTIRRVNADGITAIVATVSPLVNGPSIPGTTQHPYLRGLGVDAKGVMYVADTGDARVLKITPEGTSTTLVQLESPWSPTAVALYGNVLYVLEFLHTPGDDRTAWMPRIRKIASDGKSTIILTVDQLPGARPNAKATPANLEDEDLFRIGFLNPFLTWLL